MRVQDIHDLMVVGGGINGTGIAADAAGRGLSVVLCEAADLAGATSSASSKLIHGGLRYLEHYQFRLVKEALAEREVLLKMAPHLAFPLRFRLPHQSHLRPAWLIRAGLFLYDHLSKRTTLPRSRGVRFTPDDGLQPTLTRGFEYSDCWVDDARLVVANARQTVEKGGQVLTRTAVVSARREQGLWRVETESRSAHTPGERLGAERRVWWVRALVNATGPWVEQFFAQHLQAASPRTIRLIKGSHIVVPRVQSGPQAYILQNDDNRIVFVIPWLEKFSMIGTTDVAYHGDPRAVQIDEAEISYLLDVYNRHFSEPRCRDDVCWHFAGVRPLCDDESDSPQAMTRDYTLELTDCSGKAPLLSVFGGKLTTYRKLAQAAMHRLQPYFPEMGPDWTAKSVLPGGELGMERDQYMAALCREYPWLSPAMAQRYVSSYGARCQQILRGAQSLQDLGRHFGHDLYQAEIRFLQAQEWAMNAEDILWRRTKLGMFLTREEQASLADWLNKQGKLSAVA